MATPNVNVILQCIIAVTNNLLPPAPQLINFDFQNPTLPSGASGGTVAYYDAFFQASSGGGTLISLPAPKVFAIAVQNLSPTANLTLNYTPFGGSPQVMPAVGPNGVYIIFDPSEAGTGISSATLIASAGTVPAAVLVAA